MLISSLLHPTSLPLSPLFSPSPHLSLTGISPPYHSFPTPALLLPPSPSVLPSSPQHRLLSPSSPTPIHLSSLPCKPPLSSLLSSSTAPLRSLASTLSPHPSPPQFQLHSSISYIHLSSPLSSFTPNPTSSLLSSSQLQSSAPPPPHLASGWQSLNQPCTAPG